MFSISTSTNGSSVRCKVAGLLFVAVFLAVGFATGAQAQILQHGVSISKACVGPVRTCDTDEDCADDNLCTFETCDLTIPDTLYCEYNVGYNDDYNDTVTIVSAFDVVDPNGSAVRSPAAGDAEIIFVSGNTNCTVGGALPCFIGPDLGGGAGLVTFVEDLYQPTAADPSPLPDQANINVQDGCDGDADPQCNPNTISLVQFPAQTNLVSGCGPAGEVPCDDFDLCTDDACDPTTGLCVFTPNVDCDDGDACTDDSCDPATGLCVNTPNFDCDDGDACTDDSCDPATGLCVNTPNFDCDDADACTDDSCDPATGLCVNTPNFDCDDADVCTDDSCDPATGLCVNVPADPLPPECVDEEICRTPGFWGTHGGDEKAPKSVNVTQDVIDAAGGLDVCGTTITNTDLESNQSAIEAICVAVKGELERQLVRQLTAAALNCATASCSTAHSDLIADCNLTCADGSGTLTINECIDQLDCFNNGGTFDGEFCTFPGTCNSGGEACLTDEDCTELGDYCVPNETCHDRSLCPDGPEGEFCWFEGGPASSPAKCNAARKNDTYVP
jgi:hypothetical protein